MKYEEPPNRTIKLFHLDKLIPDKINWGFPELVRWNRKEEARADHLGLEWSAFWGRSRWMARASTLSLDGERWASWLSRGSPKLLHRRYLPGFPGFFSSVSSVFVTIISQFSSEIQLGTNRGSLSLSLVGMAGFWIRCWNESARATIKLTRISLVVVLVTNLSSETNKQITERRKARNNQ